MQSGNHVISGLKTNRIIYPYGIRQSIKDDCIVMLGIWNFNDLRKHACLFKYGCGIIKNKQIIQSL